LFRDTSDVTSKRFSIKSIQLIHKDLREGFILECEENYVSVSDLYKKDDSQYRCVHKDLVTKTFIGKEVRSQVFLITPSKWDSSFIQLESNPVFTLNSNPLPLEDLSTFVKVRRGECLGELGLGSIWRAILPEGDYFHLGVVASTKRCHYGNDVDYVIAR